MFSGRFRRTFAMLIRCKCSAINNRTTRQSYSSNRDNFSNASFRATSSLHRTNSKQLSKPPDPVMTPSMRSSLAGVERESVRGERVVRSTSASHRFIQNQHNAIYVKNQTKIQPSYCTAKLWRSTWHASTMGCNVTPQIMTSSQIPKPEAHDGTNFKRHYSANDVTEKGEMRQLQALVTLCVTFRYENWSTLRENVKFVILYTCSIEDLCSGEGAHIYCNTGLVSAKCCCSALPRA